MTEPGAGGPPSPLGAPRDAAAEDDTFDELVHAPLRLRTCALLDQAHDVRFAVLQEVLGVSASVLSKHVSALGRAGYVTVGKHWVDQRTRTTVRLTPAGRRAYRAHVAALRAIVGEG